MIYTARQWKLAGYSIRLCGHNIFYVDNGTQKDKSHLPCVLLLHGYPTSSWDWEQIWHLMDHEFRLVTLDLLGFGFSDKPYPYQYTIAEQANIVEALVKKLGLKNFHVMAHDYGDTVAQELLARQNELDQIEWQSLCLLNGGLFPETHRPKLIQRLLASPLGGHLTKLINKNSLKQNMADIFGPSTQPQEELIEGFWEVINFNNGRRTLHKLIDYMGERRQHRERWVGALQNSKVPIGLINGAVDPISGAHMVKRYKEVVGAPLMLISLSKTGHYPQLESAKETATAYKQFLDAVTSG